ncbi:hypothetical protein BGZ65_001327 [Modicella reniformis]|uniref:WH2 domain-containing protein n=1 Tax=Modicella reniformis TaxID=1440133 RepID=A0A9P6M9Z0_9FUNG|nr:hypothetical protein BGZ65_001327 [Modicella reniformis]
MGGPPPPPMPTGGGAPKIAISTNAPAEGRAGLLESIRGAGGIGALRKTGHGEPASASAPPGRMVPPAPIPTAADETEGGSGDLALALAAALQMRKSRVTGSDDEDDTDDENWDD